MLRYRFNWTRGGLLALISTFFLAHGLSVLAAAPINDLCSGALVVPSGGPFPIVLPVVADISEAANDGDPPFPECGVVLSRSIWYSFRPAQTAEYTLSVSADTLTTVADTVMAVYESTAGCMGTLTEVDCDDDQDEETRSAMFLTLTGGTQYYIVVWAYGAQVPDPGHTSVQLRVSRPIPPANDMCATAEVIPANGPFPHFTGITDITKAGTEATPSAPTCADYVSKSVWYRFTPAETAIYRISSCDDTATTADTVLALYIASNCGGPFTQIACGDDGGCVPNDPRAAVDAVLAGGATYYIVVWKWGTQAPFPGQTLVQLRVSVPPPVFTSTALLPNGSLRMEFTGLASQTYAIEGSSEFATWVELGAAQAVSPGHFRFTMPNALAPMQFFRVKVH